MGRKASTKNLTEGDIADRAKAVFLAGLDGGGTITAAAEAAGVDRSTVYRWREADEQFAESWDAAIESGTDRLEQEAVRRARDGVTRPVYQGGKQVGQTQEYSDTLLIFLLKARRPEKYRDRVSAELTGKDGKDLPGPAAIPSGVLVVPGLATDADAWSKMARSALAKE